MKRFGQLFGRAAGGLAGTFHAWKGSTPSGRLRRLFERASGNIAGAFLPLKQSWAALRLRSRRHPRRAAIAVCVASLLVLALAAASRRSAEADARANLVTTRLDEASLQSLAAVRERLLPVLEVFGTARGGSREFSHAALSWRGKWELLWGYVDGRSHDRFVEEKFNALVLDPARLREAIEAATRGYADDLERIEADFVVGLRADVPDRVPGPLPEVRVDSALAKHYRDLSQEVSRRVANDLMVNVGTEVVSQVAGQVAAGVALQAGRSAAERLGFDVGDEPSTLAQVGAGVAASFVIDYALDKAVAAAGYTPEEKLEAVVVRAVEAIQLSLIGGKDVPNGTLVVELLKVHRTRMDLRAALADDVLKGGAK